MTDSHILSVLTSAGYMTVSPDNYESLRTMCSDWPYARKQYQQCSECQNFDDRDMMHEHPETGQLICWECIKRMAEERLDDDEGMERLFQQIRSAAE